MVKKKNTARKSTATQMRQSITLQTKTRDIRKSAPDTSSASNHSRVKKKIYRYRPGTLALKEIRRYQKSTELLIRKLPFQRLVREIAQGYKTDIRFQVASLDALQVSDSSSILSFLFDLNFIIKIQTKSIIFILIFYLKRKQAKPIWSVFLRIQICVPYMPNA
jgi:histone H3